MKKIGKLLFILVVLNLCSCFHSTYRVNRRSYQSNAYSERVRFIILHYTALNDERSLTALTQNNVSSHYLVTEKKSDPVYSLVPDEKRAWHAGLSNFDGYKNLNDNSIGIEIANLGYDTRDKARNLRMKAGVIDPNIFYDYNDTQIYKIAMLIKELQEKYNVAPKYILGHSDISPTRKIDPGPKFPWKELYDKFEIGAWYDQKDFDEFYNEELFKEYEILDLKHELRNYGYELPETDEWDPVSKKIVSAFQLHFRPIKIDGEFDLETFAIIKALNKKYK